MDPKRPTSVRSMIRSPHWLAAMAMLLLCTYTPAEARIFAPLAPTFGPLGDPPNAGSDGTLAACSNGPTTDLLAALQGNPDADGIWSGPSPTTGQYDPATMQPGTYIYTVSGAGIFPDASATVIVTENQTPDAGTDGSIEVCYNSVPFTLFQYLGGNPSFGGLWSSPFGIFSGVFLPSQLPEGVYTYIAPGYGGCANDSAEVFVNVVDVQLDGISGPDPVPVVGTLAFTATPILTDAESYSWSLPNGWTWDDAAPADGVANLVPPEEAGVYSICVTASGGECAGNEVCFETEVTVGVGQEEGLNQLGLVVFPNPNNGNFSVRQTASHAAVHVLVLNAMGQHVDTFLLNSANQSIELGRFNAGTYLLNWTDLSRSGTATVVVTP